MRGRLTRGCDAALDSLAPIDQIIDDRDAGQTRRDRKRGVGSRVGSSRVGTGSGRECGRESGEDPEESDIFVPVVAWWGYYRGADTLTVPTE